MIQLSTGLASGLIWSGGFREIMEGGVIRLYSSVRPANPNMRAEGIPCATITRDGSAWLPAPLNGEGGLRVESSYPGVLTKRDTWVVKGAYTVTALWFRWCGPNEDLNTYSITAPRVDGDCGQDLILPSYEMTASTEIELQRFLVGFQQ